MLLVTTGILPFDLAWLAACRLVSSANLLTSHAIQMDHSWKFVVFALPFDLSPVSRQLAIFLNIRTNGRKKISNTIKADMKSSPEKKNDSPV